MGAEVSGIQLHRESDPKRRIAPKAEDRFRERVRELTSRSRGVSTERMAEELTRYLRGWIGYFGKCETPSVLEGLERWFRRRLPVCDLEAVETGFHEIRRTAQTGCESRSGRENGRQRTWTVAVGGFAGTPYCAAPCLLRLARDSEIDCRAIAQPAGCGPACQVVWEGRSREASPYPDSGEMQGKAGWVVRFAESRAACTGTGQVRVGPLPLPGRLSSSTGNPGHLHLNSRWRSHAVCIRPVR
jgi:hypothetical protein